MEWNPENVLDALNEFERKPDLNETLNEYLKRIAKNGEIVFPWSKLKPVIRKKLDVVLDEFYESCPVETTVPVPNFETFNYETLKKTILNAVDNFVSAPFTIQRICELVCAPQDHYNRADKYMRGIEKNVLVVSTVEPRSATHGDGNGNTNPVVNGIVSDSPRDESNDTINGHSSSSSDSVSSSNLNTPSNHVLLENFANVFPSAACIPSQSNICLTREIDNNFIASTECVEMIDVKFDSAAAPVHSSTTSRDEEMDTREDDNVNVSSDSSEVSSGESESPEHSDSSEQSDKAPESTVVQPEPEMAPSNTAAAPEPAPSDAAASEVKEPEEEPVPVDEAESTHTEPEPVSEKDDVMVPEPTPAVDPVEVVQDQVVEESQQDGTVSQSDVEPQTAAQPSSPQPEKEVSEAIPAEQPFEKVPANPAEQPFAKVPANPAEQPFAKFPPANLGEGEPVESTSEIPTPNITSELGSSEQIQSMDLEASTSTSSDEPPV